VKGGEKGEARCCDGCYAARHGSKNPQRPVVKRREAVRPGRVRIKIAPSEPCAGSGGGMRTKGDRVRALRLWSVQGLGGSVPELPCMRPSTPQLLVEHCEALVRQVTRTLAPREHSHHGRDRSMPSSVTFGASKECGGRKSPNALYGIERSQ
jgi:hypothetical protein